MLSVVKHCELNKATSFVGTSKYILIYLYWYSAFQVCGLLKVLYNICYIHPHMHWWQRLRRLTWQCITFVMSRHFDFGITRWGSWGSTFFHIVVRSDCVKWLTLSGIEIWSAMLNTSGQENMFLGQMRCTSPGSINHFAVDGHLNKIMGEMSSTLPPLLQNTSG